MKGASLILLLLSLWACDAKPEDNSSTEKATTLPPGAASSPSETSSSIHPRPQKLIKTCDLLFEVQDVYEANAALEDAVARHNGYIGSAETTSADKRIESKVTIRIPGDQFETFLSEVASLALTIDSRKITTSDAGKEFVDIEARLRTKREVEKRYQEILRNRAGTVEELLSAERQIGQLQEEIEAAVSRLNYLRDQVEFSTVRATFYQLPASDQIAGAGETFFSRLSAALSEGLSGVAAFTIFLARLWPVFVVGLPAYFVYRLRKKPENGRLSA